MSGVMEIEIEEESQTDSTVEPEIVDNSPKSQVQEDKLYQIKLSLDKRFVVLESAIASNPWLVEPWAKLIAAVVNHDPIYVRDVFERAVSQFPTSAFMWMEYATYEYKHKNLKQLEAVFARCLKTVLNVDLWKFYLGYVRQMNLDPSKPASHEQRAIVIKAYEFALAYIGLDMNSSSIWVDYIDFARKGKSENLYDEQQKMDLTRKIFTRAVQIPTTGIESIWKEYDSFENGLNKLTARKLIAERSGAYMNARSVLKELKNLLEHILMNTVAAPFKGSDVEYAQVHAWEKWINWEKSNPLKIEDKNTLHSRISYAYKQAFQFLRFYPNLWIEYSEYLDEIEKPDDAEFTLASACEILPDLIQLHFIYADLLESMKKPESNQVYENLITRLETKLANLSETLPKDPNEEVPKSLKTEIEKLHEMQSLVYVQFMRYARRSQGLKAARLVFSRARKLPHCGYQVFVASALMEYYCGKDPQISSKIFELGFKKFTACPRFVHTYLQYLIQLNDENNTRAVLERALQSLKPEDSISILELCIAHESKYGDYETLQKLVKRINTITGKRIKKSDLYEFLDLSCEEKIPSTFPSQRPHSPSTNESLTPIQKLRTQPNAPVPVKSSSSIPNALADFLSSLPKSFNGPVFETETIIKVLKKLDLPKPQTQRRRASQDGERKKSRQ